jgi:hypothetical protein
MFQSLLVSFLLFAPRPLYLLGLNFAAINKNSLLFTINVKKDMLIAD